MQEQAYSDNNRSIHLCRSAQQQHYSVKPENDNNPRQGVSTLDLVLISRHLLGLQLLDSPYQLIAADADNSGSINTFDIIEVQKLILHLQDAFPNNTPGVLWMRIMYSAIR